MEPTGERHIQEWDEWDVHSWLSSLGYSQYEAQIRGLVLRFPCHALLLIYTPEHRLSGDVLCLIDSEGLKAAGIASIGQRLAILKAVYLIKIAHDVPIEPEDYVPPCMSHPLVVVSGLTPVLAEALERVNGVSLESLYDMIKDQGSCSYISQHKSLAQQRQLNGLAI